MNSFLKYSFMLSEDDRRESVQGVRTTPPLILNAAALTCEQTTFVKHWQEHMC